MAGLSVLVAWANELTEISVFQIKDFDPNWISGDNYPNHPIIYTTNDFIQAQGIIKFIGNRNFACDLFPINFILSFEQYRNF